MFLHEHLLYVFEFLLFLTVLIRLHVDYNLELKKAGRIVFSVGYTFEYIRNAGVDKNIYKGTLTTPEQVQNARKAWEDSLYDVYNHYIFLGVKYMY